MGWELPASNQTVLDDKTKNIFENREITVNEQTVKTDDSNTVDLLSAAKEISYVLYADGGVKTVNIPSITLIGDEKVTITFRVEKDDRDITKEEEIKIHNPESESSIMEEKGDMEAEAMVSNNSKSFSLKIVYGVLNLAIIGFSITSFIYLIFALFNVVMPRTDSLFGFFLFGMNALFFAADKFYRRTKINATTSRCH